MIKAGYGKVVIEDFRPQTLYSSNYNKGKAMEVQAEINKRKVDIDRFAFKKNSVDRMKLKEAKLRYGIDTEKGRDEIIRAFLDSDVPNYNIKFSLRK